MVSLSSGHRTAGTASSLLTDPLTVPVVAYLPLPSHSALMEYVARAVIAYREDAEAASDAPAGRVGDGQT